MPDDTANLILEHLPPIRGRLDVLVEETTAIKGRLSAVESHLAVQQMELVHLNHRMDRFDERLGRIERRLDFVDA